ncbi:DNA alkylation repair protein [Clostridium estertheticum]|uniref:DNA alkylation repair protein n=1 Tax=Clostridium estertheticum TaxID=238834 RepID=UPI001CF26FD5|nr:DNA alkylation repair protein [Clostridium estertheticum]MCB2360735.1 DNA alkylation repair protein [Clostridium estertheticum]
MAEALKNMYNKEFLQQFGEQIYNVYNSFDINVFIATIIDDTWDELKLMERMDGITKTLGIFLPQKYDESLEILFKIDEYCVGFPYLFFPNFVCVYGLSDENWELSMLALKRFTIRSSSEFAVRPFIMSDPERMIIKMLEWSKDNNEHVRRLASEGCRPRLPWGMALTMFKNDPTMVLSILNQLVEDPSIYVRKSVANNLNDISKDNPSVIVETVRRLKGINKHTDWILRHGSRTLIRKSNPEIMRLFGYGESIDRPITTGATLSIDPPNLTIGESCKINYELCIREGDPIHIRIEYGIYFVRARGKTSCKLFLLSDKIVTGGQCLTGTKIHKWVELTTRKHYPGEHKIVILINGSEVASSVMDLIF